jgi:branched-chain amino acid transport system permease protein
MNTLPTGELRNIGIVTALLAVAPLPVLGSTYYESILAHLLVVAMFAVALNIVFGQTDQLFLFMGGLAGVGGYGTALLADALGTSAWITLPIAALIAGLIGLAVSWVAAKLKFTIVLISILTLNLQIVLAEVFVGARGLTGGSSGFSYRYFSLEVLAGPLGVGDKVVLYYVMLALLVGLLVLYVWLVNSKFGVAFAAIREDEVAAASIGVDVVRYKVIAGFVAALAFGLIGAFYARESAYILPSAFGFLTVDVLVLIVLIVGGLRTTLGPVVGAGIVVALEEFLVTTFTDWREPIYGLLLIFLFLYFRSGVVPVLEDLAAQYGPGGDGTKETPTEKPAE